MSEKRSRVNFFKKSQTYKALDGVILSFDCLLFFLLGDFRLLNCVLEKQRQCYVQDRYFANCRVDCDHLCPHVSGNSVAHTMPVVAEAPGSSVEKIEIKSCHSPNCTLPGLWYCRL